MSIKVYNKMTQVYEIVIEREYEDMDVRIWEQVEKVLDKSMFIKTHGSILRVRCPVGTVGDCVDEYKNCPGFCHLLPYFS